MSEIVCSMHYMCQQGGHFQKIYIIVAAPQSQILTWALLVLDCYLDINYLNK